MTLPLIMGKGKWLERLIMTLPLKSKSLKDVPSGESIEKPGAISPTFKPPYWYPKREDFPEIKLKEKHIHRIKNG